MGRQSPPERIVLKPRLVRNPGPPSVQGEASVPTPVPRGRGVSPSPDRPRPVDRPVTQSIEVPPSPSTAWPSSVEHKRRWRPRIPGSRRTRLVLLASALAANAYAGDRTWSFGANAVGSVFGQEDKCGEPRVTESAIVFDSCANLPVFDNRAEQVNKVAQYMIFTTPGSLRYSKEEGYGIAIGIRFNEAKLKRTVGEKTAAKIKTVGDYTSFVAGLSLEGKNSCTADLRNGIEAVKQHSERLVKGTSLKPEDLEHAENKFHIYPYTSKQDGPNPNVYMYDYAADPLVANDPAKEKDPNTIRVLECIPIGP